MKIAIVTLSLSCGGAERIVALTANHWIRLGHEVSVISLTDLEKVPPFYKIDPGVVLRSLDLADPSGGLIEGIVSNARRIGRLRQVLDEVGPDVVVSHLDRQIIVANLALRGRTVKHIGHIHSDPGKPDPNRLWQVARRFLLGKSTFLVVPTHRGIAQLPKTAKKVAVHIPNPVFHDRTDRMNGRSNKVVLSVANFRHEKNHDLLIHAFADASRTCPDWRLRLVGEGALRSRIVNLAKRLGIESKVEYAGRVENVGHEYRMADVYASSSRHEGFGLAIAEALANGLPVVATDCPVGPGEIVRDGVDGFLVDNEDIESFAKALGRLMEDPDLRREMASKAPEILDRCGLEIVMEQWKDLMYSNPDPDDAGKERMVAVTHALTESSS